MKINIEHPAITAGIDYVCREIYESIHFASPNFYRWNHSITDEIKNLSIESAIPLIKSKNWLKFSPAETSEEIEELHNFIDKYGKVEKDDLLFYFWYHGCESFVILLWVILKVNKAINPKIVHDNNFGHYFVLNDDEIINPFWEWAGIETPLTINSKFDDPYAFISQTYMEEPYQECEKEKLDLLKNILSIIKEHDKFL